MIHTSYRETIHDLGNDSHSVLILSIHSYTIHKGRSLCLGFGKFHFPEMVPPVCKVDQCDRYFASPHPFRKRYNGLFNQTTGEGWIPFMSFNAIVPGRYGSNLGGTIFKFIIQNSNLIAHSLWDCSRWISQNRADEKLILVQVMPWCRQTTSHYLSQRVPRYMSPYGFTWPQWVNKTLIYFVSWFVLA